MWAEVDRALYNHHASGSLSSVEVSLMQSRSEGFILSRLDVTHEFPLLMAKGLLKVVIEEQFLR
jgi:hypothetical protein